MTTADGNEGFHLLFHGPDKDYLDISYVYNKRGALVVSGIKKLPSGWAVGFQAGETNLGKFIITQSENKPGCIFEFDAAALFQFRPRGLPVLCGATCIAGREIRISHALTCCSPSPMNKDGPFIPHGSCLQT